MDDPQKAFNALDKRLRFLGVRFLDGLPLTSPLDASQQAAVDAYVVLAHAAFEEYFEELVLWAVDVVVTHWGTSGMHRHAIATIILHAGKGVRLDDETPESKSFDRVREALDDAQKALSAGVKANHGISIKYLRKMFYPVGIDIPQDSGLRASLETFVQLRGGVAHKVTVHGPAKQRGPTDIRNLAADCRELAMRMRDLVAAV